MSTQPMIHAILSTGNDADIVGQSLRHNLRWLERVVVIDNNSRDETRAIVREIQREVPDRVELVEAVFRSPDELVVAVNYYRARLRTESDFMFLLDADEFIVAENLRELQSIPKGSVGQVRWRTYLPERLDHTNFAREMRFRRNREPEGCHKIVVPSMTDGASVLGNHYLLQGNSHAPVFQLESIFLAHYPVRSLRQMNSKIEFMTRVFQGIDASQSYHLRDVPRLETLEQLVEKSLNYCERGDAVYQRVYDPLYGG